MRPSTCLADAELEPLFLGALSEADAQAREEHLLQCPRCLERLKALQRSRDTLAGLLRHDETRGESAADPAVAGLLQRLKALRPASAFSQQGAPMLNFACPGCNKKLAVNESLAGKKVKCPGCGSVVTAPAAAAAVGPAGGALPPSQVPLKQLPPRQAEFATPAPTGARDVTVELPPSSHDTSLMDFLAPPQAPDELGRLGKYRILKVLGQGGMGVVYLAEDPLLKRAVALKAMLPTLAASASAGQRFLREAQSMAAVESDHVVRVHEVAVERGIPFLAMEFLRGEPLDARIERGGKLPLPEVVRIGKEIAEGLAAAHERGLIHRDIKPGNIWLESRGQAPGARGQGGPGTDASALTPDPRPLTPARVKILDFGLARSADQDSGLTRQGAIIGTPAFMAPEQGRGEKVDGRCDLFSLGVILYRLCCGKQAFAGQDTISTLMAVATHQPTPPALANPELPRELSDLVMQLLEKDRDRRPASAAQVAEALAALEKRLRREPEPPEPRSPAPLPKPGTAPSRRRRAPVLVALALLLGGLVGAGLWGAGLIRFSTPEGDVVIRTDDPEFSFRVDKESVFLKDAKTSREYKLKVLKHDPATGAYDLEVTDLGADLAFKAKNFTIRRGETVALAASVERKTDVAPPPVVPPTEDRSFAQQLAAARWALENGSTVTIRKDGKEQKVHKTGASRALKDFPPAPFTIVRLSMSQVSNPQQIQLADADLARIAVLGDLEELDLVRQPITAAGLAHLAPLKELRRLQMLSIKANPTEGAATVRGFPKLENLSAASDWIQPLEGMPSLRRLVFYRARLTAAELGRLKQFPKLACVEILDCGPDEKDLLLLKEVKTLRLLVLSHLHGGDDVLQRLAKEMPECEIRKVLGGGKPDVVWNPGKGAEVYTLAGVPPTLLPIPEAWFKEVAALPAEKQVEAVAAKLKERNPGWDGKLTYTSIRDGEVAGVSLSAVHLSDLSPLQAWPALTMLTCQGSLDAKLPSLLHDLSPLAKLKLTQLGLPYVKVADLKPLQGMPLRYLNCDGTLVADLSPLAGMPLTVLVVRHTQVKDLSPLAGLPLKEIVCDFQPARDAAILRSIPTLEKINGKPAAEFWKEVAGK